MREIGSIFRAYCRAKHTEWPLYVQKVEEWLNSTTHESTGFTPYELIKGTRPPRILEQLSEYPPEDQTIDMNVKIQLANESLLTKGERRKQRHDAKGKWTKYEEGQLVLVKRHDLSSAQDKEIKKFFLLYEGPYEVIEVKMHNAYAVSYTHLDVYKRQSLHSSTPNFLL